MDSRHFFDDIAIPLELPANLRTSHQPTPLSQPGSDHEEQSSHWEDNSTVVPDNCTLQSLPTEITWPSFEWYDGIDDGIAISEDMSHILSPASYYGELDRLEIETAKYCGVDQSPRILKGSYSECQKDLNSILAAIEMLQEEGFCGESFSILVEDESRHSVANAVRISQDEIHGLKTKLDTFLRSAPFPESFNNLAYVSSFPIISGLFDASPSRESMTDVDVDWLPFWQFVSTVLSIGLLSFSGSHVCRFDLNIWQEDMREIDVGQGYSFSLRDLACLKGLVGGPAWVLGRTRESPLEVGLKVSLTLQDPQDLWGPVWLTERESGQKDFNAGPLLRTETGYIVPQSYPLGHLNDSVEEVECHWTKEPLQGIGWEQSIPLSSKSKLLIGAEGILNSTDSASNMPIKSSTGELTQNLNCNFHWLQGHIVRQLQPPGSHNGYYASDGLDFQAQGGQYLTIGIVKKYKRIPARKWKTSIIDACKHRASKLPLVPLPKHFVGLEVSTCTGNALRVTLWDALRLSHTGSNIPGSSSTCIHAIADPSCIESCWTRCYSTSAIDSSIWNIQKDRKMSNDDIRSVIINSVIALEHTGIDHNGCLQTFWPLADDSLTRRLEPSTPKTTAAREYNNWFRLIKDTRDSAAFAVSSERCLEFRDAGHRGSCSVICQSQSQNQPVNSPETVLSTRLWCAFPWFQTQEIPVKVPTGSHGSSTLHVGERFMVGEAVLTARKIIVGSPSAIIATTNSSSLQNGLKKALMRGREFQEDLNANFEKGFYVDLVVH